VQNSREVKLGIREFSMMLLLLLGSKFADTTPTLLFKRAKNAAWMLPIISAVIMLPSFLILLSLLKKYKDKNFIEIIYIIMGKYIGFIYSILISTIMFIYMIIISRDVVDTIITMFYPSTPPIVIYLLLMATAIFICRRGLTALGGVCWMIVPILVVTSTLTILLTLPDMKLQYIYPIGGIKITELIQGIPFFASITIEILVLSILYPKVKSHDEYKKGTFIALIIAVIFISAFCVAYVLVFDTIAVQHIPFLYLELTRIIRIGRFVSNSEAAFLGFWISAAGLRLSLYLYMTTSLFLNTFHRKNLKPFFPLFAALCLFFGLLPENFSFILFTFRKYLLLTSFTVIVPQPYLLYFLSKRK
jgi:spore germination protein (amino acid permease)